MAILNFQKPDKIALQKTTDFEAQFEFRPLEPGYGVTIGNALRRVLLSSLEGFAITAIRIPGADHFSGDSTAKSAGPCWPSCSYMI